MPLPTQIDHNIALNRALEAACAKVRAAADAGPVFYFTGPFGMGGQLKADPTPFQTRADYSRFTYSVFRKGVIRQMTADEQRAWIMDGVVPGNDVPALQQAAE